MTVKVNHKQLTVDRIATCQHEGVTYFRLHLVDPVTGEISFLEVGE